MKLYPGFINGRVQVPRLVRAQWFVGHAAVAAQAVRQGHPDLLGPLMRVALAITSPVLLVVLLALVLWLSLLGSACGCMR